MKELLRDMAREKLYGRDEMTWGTQHTHTWTANSSFEFLLIGLVIQTFIRERTKEFQILNEGKQAAFAVQPNKTVPVLRECITTFYCDGQLYTYDATDEHSAYAHTLRSPGDVSALVERLDHVITHRNPLRGRFLHTTMSMSDVEVKLGEPAPVSRESLVLPPKLTHEKLLRDVLWPLKMGDGAGTILHGKPGTGKSRTGAWLACRALQEGFTVVLVSSRIDFEKLQAFLRYLGPTLLILEDIDTNVGEDRIRGSGHAGGMSDFLQALSGIEQGPFPVSVVATTNHLELLDEAIRQRPGRFGRIWEYGTPEPNQVEALLDVHFPNVTLTPAQRAEVVACRMTGDLIRELARTMRTIVHAEGCRNEEAFAEAIATLRQHFNLEEGGLGFFSR